MNIFRTFNAFCLCNYPNSYEQTSNYFSNLCQRSKQTRLKRTLFNKTRQYNIYKYTIKILSIKIYFSSIGQDKTVALICLVLYLKVIYATSLTGYFLFLFIARVYFAQNYTYIYHETAYTYTFCFYENNIYYYILFFLIFMNNIFY